MQIGQRHCGRSPARVSSKPSHLVPQPRTAWQRKPEALIALCSDAKSPETSTSGRGSADEELVNAWSLLKAFSAAQFRGLSQQYVGTAAARAKLREALMLAYKSPCAAEGWNPAVQPEVLLGVVASDSRLGVRALRDWCLALDLGYTLPDSRVAGAGSIAAVQGPVYIKYNSVSKVCYMSQYKGQDRGVLVQLGQGPMLGHFPLGFFDEAMSNPPPTLDASAAGSS